MTHFTQIFKAPMTNLNIWYCIKKKKKLIICKLKAVLFMVFKSIIILWSLAPRSHFHNIIISRHFLI